MKLLPWAIEAYAVLSLVYQFKFRLRARRERRLLAEYHKMLDEGIRERRLAESSRRLFESRLQRDKRRLEMEMSRTKRRSSPG